MLLCHFKFSFKEDKLNFRFIGTLIRATTLFMINMQPNNVALQVEEKRCPYYRALSLFCF